MWIWTNQSPERDVRSRPDILDYMNILRDLQKIWSTTAVDLTRKKRGEKRELQYQVTSPAAYGEEKL